MKGGMQYLNWKTVGSVTGSQTWFLDTDLLGGTTYWYRMSVTNLVGSSGSGWGGVGTYITTPPDSTTLPGSPKDMKAVVGQTQ
jgi:hypothetical protein